jgi:hypothetical protein
LKESFHKGNGAAKLFGDSFNEDGCEKGISHWFLGKFFRRASGFVLLALLAFGSDLRKGGGVVILVKRNGNEGGAQIG